MMNIEYNFFSHDQMARYHDMHWSCSPGYTP